MRKLKKIQKDDKAITIIALIITIVLNCSYLAMERKTEKKPIN